MVLNALPLFLLLLSLGHTVIADTEIVNFSVAYEGDISIPPSKSWPTLNYARGEGQWALLPAKLNAPLDLVCVEPSKRKPCSHELWLVLDSSDDRWLRHSKFTLRLSWPGFHPGRFRIDVYTPETLAREMSLPRSIATPRASRTRARYARIRVVDIGVRSPSATPSEPEPIPFILVLEPLYFGVLPATVLPTILFLIPLVFFASLAVPYVYRYLCQIAEQSREELKKSD